MSQGLIKLDRQPTLQNKSVAVFLIFKYTSAKPARQRGCHHRMSQPGQSQRLAIRNSGVEAYLEDQLYPFIHSISSLPFSNKHQKWVTTCNNSNDRHDNVKIKYSLKSRIKQNSTIQILAPNMLWNRVCSCFSFHSCENGFFKLFERKWM